jgi:hypothetical protein
MFKSAESFFSNLSAGITPASTSVTLPAGAISFLTTLGIDGTNYTEAALSDGVSFEIVQLNQVVGSSVSITRAQAGTTAASFPNGTSIRFVWTANGVQEEAAAIGASVTFTSNIVGAITGGPAVFNVDFPMYSAGANLVLTGTYPNFTIGLDPGYSPPVGGTVTSVTGTADFGITNTTTTPLISLSNIFPTVGGGNAFGAGLSATGVISGIRVSNTGRVMEVVTTALPNGVFTNPQITVANGIITAVATGAIPDAPISSGTVTIVNAGTGIAVSGVPTSTPTVGIANTGVVAGSYEGVQINAQGQIVTLPGGFGPISSITTSTPGVTISSGGTGIRTIAIGAASEAVQGLVEIADNSEAANFSTVDRVLTPAKLKVALNSLGSFVTHVVTTGSLTGPALTNVVQTALVNLADFVLVNATVVFSDPTAGADEYNQSFSIGIYVNGVAHTVLPAFKSGQKNISAIVTTYPGGVIDIRSTTPTGSQVVSGTINCVAVSDVV